VYHNIEEENSSEKQWQHQYWRENNDTQRWQLAILCEKLKMKLISENVIM
jgi:hypothetical protein